MKNLFVLLLLFSYPAFAADSTAAKPMPLEYQEQMDDAKKTLNLLDQSQNLLQAQVVETEGQCMKAIGASEFCKCISWQTPGDFIQYVAIISKTKDDLGYDKLSKGDKELVDTIRKARTKCVK
jgi:hypothetical protein